MGSTGDSKKIERILILGDNFPATPIIHALSQLHYNNYTLHIAHPHSPSTPHRKNAIFHTCRINATALSPLLQEIQPDLVIDTTSGSFESSKRALIDRLIEAGVPRFVASDFGHDSLNERIQERLPAYRERAKIVEFLRSAAGGKLSWCAVAVGVVLDRGLLSGNLGFDLSWRNATMHGSGDEAFAASSESWIGRVVLGMLDHWEEVQGRYLYAAGMVTSSNAVLRGLEGETGTEKPWTADRGDVEQCVREARQRIERGFPDAGMFLMERSVLYDESLDAPKPFESADVKETLGLGGGEDINEVVGRVVHEHEQHGGRKGGCGCD